MWKQLNLQKGTAERMWVLPDKGGTYIHATPFVELSGLLSIEEFAAKAKEFADASAKLENQGINQTELKPDSSVLNLQDLLLMSLPDAIDWSAFSHLTKVQFDNNRLSTLPESLSHLSNLQSLFLQQNLFFKLPTIISRFSQLTHLDISQNPIVLEPEALTQMPSLVWLGISIDQTIPRISSKQTLTEWVIKELQSKNPNFTYKVDQKRSEPFCIHDDPIKKSFCNFTFFCGLDPTRNLKYLCMNGSY
ncbi:MAG: leucine-rich repeat domain-containing protein [Verrucomicrobia bacterium]|nr:leucine-rich repeat domain-containing protein [Verrucomicrobiota bacterium]